jgi:hypothetical protein
MDEPFFDRIQTVDRVILVTTKTRFYGIFTRPRTYVMPEGFRGPRGFVARYNTSDPEILEDFHRFWVEGIAYGGFEKLLAAAKQGRVEFPPEREHLGKFIIGFNA